MTNWAELRNQLTALAPSLEAWGEYVRATLVDQSREVMLRPNSLQFSSKRVKEEASALGKIQRKGYTNPMEQMTDLIGVRLIALLSTDVHSLGKMLEAHSAWTFELSRDPAAESAQDPERFQYQSLHYLVRPASDLDLGGVIVPRGLACEVQIRTLLQHAYAEMVHDSIYKATGKVPARANRFVASSMALMETADHLLCETMRLLDEESASLDGVLQGLKAIYSSQIRELDAPYDAQLNLFVIDELRSELPPNVATEVGAFLTKNEFIAQKIRDHRKSADPFWAQPVSVLAYWLVDHDRDAIDKWPLALSVDALQQVYSDLGVSLYPH